MKLVATIQVAHSHAGTMFRAALECEDHYENFSATRINLQRMTWTCGRWRELRTEAEADLPSLLQ